ncbi:MAG TPA: malectin, partial [Planctomycetota bacterium]|nr:malectin [Planctomycetota bacterium]
MHSFRFTGRQGVLSLVLLGGLFLGAMPARGTAQQNADTSWMKKAKYGLFMHYQYRILLGYSLNGLQPPEAPASAESPAGWNAFVDGFDVNGFGDQMVAGHVGWVLFCIDDAPRGWQCTPNATFDGFTGYAPGNRCSNRDLIHDLSVALHARGVKLICYWAGLVGWSFDTQTFQGMAGDPNNPSAPPTAESRRRRLAVLQEYCNRWGTQVDGWWFDGMNPGLYDGTTYNYASINSIVRTPNPSAVIAFSWGGGQTPAGNSAGSQGDLAPGVQDFAGGDSWSKMDLTQYTPTTYPGDSRILWHGKMYCGNIYHGQGTDNQYTDQELIDWLNTCNNEGGICTMDWPIDPPTGRLKDFGAAQLDRVASAVWGTPPPPPPPPVAGYQINAGGAASGTWSADADFDTGLTATTTSAIDVGSVHGPAPQAVYQSERYGNFTYTLPNLSPSTPYTVRLHFAEFYWTTTGQRVFNVSLNGSPVLTNYDIVQDAGGPLVAIVKDFSTSSDSNGNLTISFSTVVDNAKVSGIEVVAASSGPPPSPGPTPGPGGSS